MQERSIRETPAHPKGMRPSPLSLETTRHEQRTAIKKTKKSGNDLCLPSLVATHNKQSTGGRRKSQKKKKSSEDGRAPTQPAHVAPVHATKCRTTKNTVTHRAGKPHSFSHRAHRSRRRRHDRNANAGHQIRPATRPAERPLPQQPSRCLSRRSSSPERITPHDPFVPFKGGNSVLRALPALSSITNSSSRGRWRRRIRGGSPTSENSGKISQGGDRHALQVGYDRASDEGSLLGQDELQGEVERGSSAQKNKKKTNTENIRKEFTTWPSLDTKGSQLEQIIDSHFII